MGEKLEANIPAMRITKQQHAVLLKLAEQHMRTIQDQARYCLCLGMEVEEVGSIQAFIKREVKKEVQALMKAT